MFLTLYHAKAFFKIILKHTNNKSHLFKINNKPLLFLSVDARNCVILHRIEIFCSHIAVVDPRKEQRLFAIGQRMTRSIPSSIANIKTSKKSNFLINNYKLFMMTPHERDYVIWMPSNLDIRWMQAFQF